MMTTGREQAGRGNLTGQAPEPRRHPTPIARMRWRAEGSKQAKPREQPQHRRISPSVVSMRRGGRREAMGRDDIGTDIDGGAKRSRGTSRGTQRGTARSQARDDEMTGRSVKAYGGKHQASRREARRRGGYHMSRLSASYHPVSNTRQHGNRDDDEITQEAKQTTASR